MHAVRNPRLCMKDCLCLFVCPTGATDTEDGQIDACRCIGCGMCFKACSSHAISLVPEMFPVQQPKREQVIEPIYALARSRAEGELMASHLCESKDPTVRLFATALRESFRRQGEDLFREAGYMLPQSRNVRRMLTDMVVNETDPDFPKAAALRLLQVLQEQDR